MADSFPCCDFTVSRRSPLNTILSMFWLGAEMTSTSVVALTSPVNRSSSPSIAAVRIKYPALTITSSFEGDMKLPTGDGPSSSMTQ